MNDLRAMPLWLRLARATRSAVFVVVLLAYLTFVTGLVQRVILIPFTWMFPQRAPAVLGPWGRLQGRNILRLLRVFGGVRMTVEGGIGLESSVIVMNHQSMVDIPIGLSLVPGPMPLLPTRKRYAWGFPGASVYVRVLARFPLISQTRKGARADLLAIGRGIERTRRGETSFLIFPEGHRTKDGSILPFMIRGLKMAISRIQRPVYCIVADGMWKSRTLADTMVNVAGSHIRVRVIGPFHPPEQDEEIPAFIDDLRARMIATLEDIRANAS